MGVEGAKHKSKNHETHRSEGHDGADKAKEKDKTQEKDKVKADSTDNAQAAADKQKLDKEREDAARSVPGTSDVKKAGENAIDVTTSDKEAVAQKLIDDADKLGTKSVTFDGKTYSRDNGWQAEPATVDAPQDAVHAEFDDPAAAAAEEPKMQPIAYGGGEEAAGAGGGGAAAAGGSGAGGSGKAAGMGGKSKSGGASGSGGAGESTGAGGQQDVQNWLAQLAQLLYGSSDPAAMQKLMALSPEQLQQAVGGLDASKKGEATDLLSKIQGSSEFQQTGGQAVGSQASIPSESSVLAAPTVDPSLPTFQAGSPTAGGFNGYA